MGALILILVSMGIKDVFGAAYTLLLTGRRPWLAGSADGLTDLLSYGFVGISIYNHPHRTEAWTALAFAALFLGSLIGTRIGAWFESWIKSALVKRSGKNLPVGFTPPA